MTRAGMALVIGLVATACGAPAVWTSVSPDRRTSLTVAAQGPLSCVILGDAPDVCYDGVNVDGVIFSERGGHAAYPAQAGGRWTVVRDGVPGPMWDGVGTPALSSDGARLAYPAFDGEHWRMVVDEASGAPYDAIVANSIRFGAGLARVGYVAQRADSFHVVIDGIASVGWSAVRGLTLGENAPWAAYVARHGYRTSLVVDGRTGLPHDAIGDVAISADGARQAYAAREGAFWYTIDGHTRHGPFDSVRAVAIAQATGRLSFVARMNGADLIVLDGEPGHSHSAVHAPVFSRKSARWGYVAVRPGRSLVFIDGVLVAEEEEARDLVLSDDGHRLAYVAQRQGTVEVVDDRGRHRFDLVIDGTLQFLPDGRWVCLVGDRARRELRVGADGVLTSRVVRWTDLVALAGRADAAAGLRALVAAEAQIASAGPPPR